MKKIFLLIIISLTIVSIVYLAVYFNINKSVGNADGSRKIQVTTSFYPLYFLAKEIGGDKVDVYNLIPSGSEPHDYEPSARDIAGIEKSDILILNGGGVETWGEKMKTNLKDKKTAVIEAGKGLFTENPETGDNAVTDPHIWLSPEIYKKEAVAVTDILRKIDPANDEYFSLRKEKITAKLDNLNKLFREGLTDCTQKEIITSHSAFGYLAKAYGLSQVAITGLAPESEPSQSQMMEIVKFARVKKVKYIFFESLVSPKLSETIAQEIGAGTLVLDPLEGITDEEMKKGADYFSIMEKNLKNIKLALECKS